MKPTAFPEVLKDGGDYRVLPGQPGQGVTNRRTKTMIVPVADTDTDRFVRLHELAHAKWTPAEDPSAFCIKFKVDEDVLQAAEDCRIHLGLLSSQAIHPEFDFYKTELGTELLAGLINLATNPGVPLSARIRAVACQAITLLPLDKGGSSKTLIAAVISALETTKHEQILPEDLKTIKLALRTTLTAGVVAFSPRHTRTKIPHFDEAYELSRHYSQIGEPTVPKFDRTIELAQWLQKAFPHEGPGKMPDVPRTVRDQQQDEKRSTRPKESFGEKLDLPRGPGAWGQAYLETAPMDRNAHAARILNTKVPSDMGTRMRTLDRIFTDSKVFERRKKVLGGTILVDTSGSMSLSPSDVEELVRLAPAATVAIYNGCTQPESTIFGTSCPADSGVIRIVAQRGYIANPSTRAYRGPLHGANVIDGPALQWLGMQHEPRVWVSDGHVTGCGEHQNDFLRQDAEMICQTRKICRVPSVPQAIGAYRNLKAGIKVKHQPVPAIGIDL